MKALAIILFTALALTAGAQPISSFKLKDVSGKYYDLSELKKNKGSVLVFLSPECPICQKYTLTINQVERAFSDQGIMFYAIFPGKNFKSRAIKNFAMDYGVTMPLLLDPDYVLTKSVGATVTPEAILFKPDGTVQYAGKVDNWYEDIGTRRAVITEYYLKDAINGLLIGTDIKVKRTTPVGCFIF